jgi:hypothetical protein
MGSLGIADEDSVEKQDLPLGPNPISASSCISCSDAPNSWEDDEEVQLEARALRRSLALKAKSMDSDENPEYCEQPSRCMQPLINSGSGGAIIVFVPGWHEIQRLVDMVSLKAMHAIEVLYAREDDAFSSLMRPI